MTLPRKVGLAIGLFGVIGVGLGLSGYISISFMQEAFVEGAEDEFMQGFGQMLVAVVTLQSAFVFFLLGSVVATISATSIAKETKDVKEAALANGAASFVGFYVMVGLAIAIMMLALGASGDGNGGGATGDLVDLADLVVALVKIGIPTGLVGVASGAIISELR